MSKTTSSQLSFCFIVLKLFYFIVYCSLSPQSVFCCVFFSLHACKNNHNIHSISNTVPRFLNVQPPHVHLCLTAHLTPCQPYLTSHNSLLSSTAAVWLLLWPTSAHHQLDSRSRKRNNSTIRINSSSILLQILAVRLPPNQEVAPSPMSMRDCFFVLCFFLTFLYHEVNKMQELQSDLYWHVVKEQTKKLLSKY